MDSPPSLTLVVLTFGILFYSFAVPLNAQQDNGHVSPSPPPPPPPHPRQPPPSPPSVASASSSPKSPLIPSPESPSPTSPESAPPPPQFPAPPRFASSPPPSQSSPWVPPPPPLSPPSKITYGSDHPPNNTVRGNHDRGQHSRGQLSTQREKKTVNWGKKIGLMFVGIVGILQVCVVAFLVIRRRQLFKDESRF